MRFSNELDIARPIADVFDFLADATNIPAWNYYVTDVERVDNGPLGTGATFAQTRRHDRQRYRIDVYDPPHELVLQTEPGQEPAFRRTFTLHTSGHDATRLVDSWDLNLDVPPLLRRPASAKVSRAVATNLQHLKRLLETGQHGSGSSLFSPSG